MKYYFQLQFKRLFRHLNDAGFNPVLLVVVVAAGFIGLSYLLFEETKYASLVYLAMVLSILSSLGNATRINFLKNSFGQKDFRQLRILENLLIVGPFALFLLFYQDYIYALGFVILGIAMSFAIHSRTFGFVIPTPFYKRPFEFIIGFRKSYLAVIISLVLIILSVLVKNFNIGIFGLMVTFFISLNFYMQPESEYFVWIHSSSPTEFLIEKIKTSVLHSFIISLPLVIVLSIFFNDKIAFVFLVQGIGVVYVITSLLAKYAYFPSEINLTQGIIIAFSLMFPPLLLVLAPYLFSKSKQNLARILK